jgi:hypothetical protein
MTVAAAPHERAPTSSGIVRNGAGPAGVPILEDSREQHSDRELVEVSGQRNRELVREPHRSGGRECGERGCDEHETSAERDGASRQPVDREGEQGQCRVEGDLDTEGPRGSDEYRGVQRVDL